MNDSTNAPADEPGTTPAPQAATVNAPAPGLPAWAWATISAAAAVALYAAGLGTAFGISALGHRGEHPGPRVGVQRVLPPDSGPRAENEGPGGRRERPDGRGPRGDGPERSFSDDRPVPDATASR